MHIAGVLIILLAATMVYPATLVFADPLRGSTKQRIGNYDMEMITDPKSPAAGDASKIMVRIAGVNGDDLVDVPIVVRILKDGTELQRTNPIVVPYGHYVYNYTFTEPGMYALYIDLKDYAYSGETLTFTFPIKIQGPTDYAYSILPIAGGIAAVAVGAAVVIRRRQKLTLN